jgi:hypothetical protein
VINIIYIICIIVFIIIWPVGMIVPNACSGDVRVAGYVLEEERSECLNRTSGKIQPESRHLHSQRVGRKLLKVGRTLLSGITLHSAPCTLHLLALSGEKCDGSISGYHYQYLDSIGSIYGHHYQFLDNKKFNEFNKRLYRFLPAG